MNLKQSLAPHLVIIPSEFRSSGLSVNGQLLSSFTLEVRTLAAWGDSYQVELKSKKIQREQQLKVNMS